MLCPVCGSAIADGSRFCTVCGSALEVAPAAPMGGGGMSPGGVSGLNQEPGYVQGGTSFAMPSSDALRSGITGQPGNTAATAFSVGAAAYDSAFGVDGTGQWAAAQDTSNASYRREARRQRKREGRLRVGEAKEQLREARREAGISPVPRVLFTVLLIVVLAGASGAVGWYVASGSLESQLNEANEQISAKDAEIAELKGEEASTSGAASNDAASSDATASASGGAAASTASSAASGSANSSSSSDYSAYLGAWAGKLDKTETSYAGRCYAADAQPVSITLKSIDANGKMKLDISLLYHNHGADSTSDVDSCDGDTYETYSDVTSTLEADGSFDLKITTGADGEGSISVTCTFDKVGDVLQQRMSVKVVSDAGVWGVHDVTDTFTLTKA